MGFVVFMFATPFLNDTETSLWTSGCYYRYSQTVTVLKMCTKMAKADGIPSKESWFPEGKSFTLNVYGHAYRTIHALMVNVFEKERKSPEISAR